MRTLKKQPPADHLRQTFGELIQEFNACSGWGYQGIAIASGPNKNSPLTVDAIKTWATRGSLPDHNSRTNLYNYIREKTDNDQSMAKAWIEAFEAAFHRDRIQKKEEKEKRDDKIIKKLQKTISTNPKLTHLPALFETDHPLPLATTYVELRLAPASPVIPSPTLLEVKMTIATKIQKRMEKRFSIKRPPEELLDIPQNKTHLILGAPGSGKSSLLRQIALNIAAGKWKTAKIPLFIEVRSYVKAATIDPSLSLLNFSLQQLSTIDLEDKQLEEILFPFEKPSIGIILIDGLDEIASNTTAVDLVYGQLVRLEGKIPWIATTRPSGLMNSLYEDQRLEMVELDFDSIITLVENWSSASRETGIEIDTQSLILELERMPNLYEMATNPFLLTALCFLKSTAPNEGLPASRIEVYETLLNRIASQAQKKYGSSEILSTEAIKDLSDFSCFLYQHSENPIQIFNASHWQSFKKSKNILTDFDRQILPTRLLTVWSEIDTQYHFIHLTLQEHLIARAMFSWPVEDALKYRFIPQWRSVFRFYGALLKQSGRNNDFRNLTTKLYKEMDLNKLSLITLTEIFADAGIQDTTDWIGDDLREELFMGVIAGYSLGAEALIDSLTILDPEWLYDSTIHDLEENISFVVKQLAYSTNHSGIDGYDLIEFGRDINNPYLRLARANTAKSKNKIRKTFWGKDKTHSLISAFSFSEIANAHDRQKIFKLAKSCTKFDDKALRILAFTDASRHIELVPFLIKIIDNFTINQELSEYAMRLLAEIGGQQAANTLEKK